MEKQTVYNIVLVDDDPDDRFLFREALEGISVVHDYHEFEDGNALVGYLHTAHTKSEKKRIFSLIFLDLNMPKLSGKDVLQEINKHPWENIATVIWTTSSKPEFRETCLQLGADYFVTKPNTFRMLEDTLSAIVQSYYPR